MTCTSDLLKLVKLGRLLYCIQKSNAILEAKGQTKFMRPFFKLC
jgi:hypothetical protein